jgi:two-component system sensor histidine kinase VicK
MDKHFEIVTQVGHDLNKYLARIKAYNYLLLNRFEKKLTKEEKSFFEGIDQECDSMFRFISDLVTADKVSTEGGNHEFEMISLPDFIRTLSQRYQASARLKGIEIQVEKKISSLYANVHKNTFERALNNLIHNALKFTPKNGKIHIGWSLCPCERFTDITFTDTGIGIPAQLQPYIFDKFTRAGRKGMDGEESNGLGMYITKNIIEKHGGCIWFETEEYIGTTFTIKLPIVKPDA